MPDAQALGVMYGRALPRPMMGIIGGTGLARLAGAVETHRSASGIDMQLGRIADVDVAFIPRHGTQKPRPAHRVAHAAHMDALQELGVDTVLAISNVGGLQPGLDAGSWIVPDDLIDISGQVHTRFDDDIVHVGMRPPFCPHVRSALLEALDAEERPRRGGTYVQVPGPRLETAAEIRFYQGLGHIIGMTGAPEATHAREAGLCYANLCFVANAAAGLGERDLDANQIKDAMSDAAASAARLLATAVTRIPDQRDCICRDAPRSGRIS